jgi:hypothetical protein
MQLIKVLRLRPSETNIQNRLLANTFDDLGAPFNTIQSYPSERQELFVPRPRLQFRGGYEDVRLEVYEKTVTSDPERNPEGISETWTEFELKFIKLFKPTFTGSAPAPDTIKKYSNYKNQYGDTKEEAIEFVINEFIVRNAFAILTKNNNTTVANTKSKTYYKIIQDPWQDEPPLERNYGFDPYFLNNRTKVQIYWYLPPTNDKLSFYDPKYGAGLTGGVNYSNNDGTESYNRFISALNLIGGPVASDLEPGFSQNEADIQFAKDEKKKIIKSLSAEGFGSDSKYCTFILSSNDIIQVGTSSGTVSVTANSPEPDTFPGDVNDLDIINKFIDIWKKKVPNYDLKLCVPNFFPNDVNLEFKNPATQSLSTPKPDNQSPTQNTADEVKFNLSVVYDENVTIKAGQDLPSVDIYVGNPPKEEAEFYFEDRDEFEELYQLDEEYVETDYSGQEQLEREQIADALDLTKGQEYLQNNPNPQGSSTGNNGDPNQTNPQNIRTTATGKIKKMIEIALGEIGYLETRPGGLPSPGKDTKYGVYWGLNGLHYCGMFCCWCAEHAGMIISPDRGVWKKPANQGNAIACGGSYGGTYSFGSRNAFVSNGRTKAERASSKVDPEPGDFVFFSWGFNNTADHVGIVLEVLPNGNILTVEGNTSPQKKLLENNSNGLGAGVWKCERPRSFIYGYGKTAVFDSTNLNEFTGPVGKAKAGGKGSGSASGFGKR